MKDQFMFSELHRIYFPSTIVKKNTCISKMLLAEQNNYNKVHFLLLNLTAAISKQNSNSSQSLLQLLFYAIGVSVFFIYVVVENSPNQFGDLLGRESRDSRQWDVDHALGLPMRSPFYYKSLQSTILARDKYNC